MVFRHHKRYAPLKRSGLVLAGVLGLILFQSQWAVDAKKEAVLEPSAIMDINPVMDLSRPEKDNRAPVFSAIEPVQAKAVMVDVKSDVLNYDKNRDVYIATGSVHVVISEQNSELYADKVTWDQNNDLLIAEGNVVIFKNGDRTDGTFAKIDLTRESALINDIATTVDKVRIEAKQSLTNEDVLIFEKGQLIITADALAGAMGKKSKKKTVEEPDDYEYADNTDLSKLASNVSFADNSKSEGVNEETILMTPEESEKDFFSLEAREIDMFRWSDGYSKIDVHSPRLKVGKFKFPLMPASQFSMDDNTGEVEYLGPDVGYDPDYGGLYAGPGWDFRLGKGSLRLSPTVSYGGPGRRARGGSTFESASLAPGVGGIMRYRGPGSILDVAYNSNVSEPVIYGEKKLFDGKTKIRATMNEDYTAGFLGYERPRYGAMLSDHRKVGEWHNLRLETYESVGFFKDEFYPFNSSKQFVATDPSATPVNAGRLQLQARLRNAKPIFQLGEHVDFGFSLTAGTAAYTTGDFVGLVRGGPTMGLRFGNRFRSRMQYQLAETFGETPFAFDTYYRGRQSLWMTNSYLVNDYLTVGSRVNVSLKRDNAAGDLFTGNALYVLVGPKSIKLNLAYDVIRQRSYFGIKFFPGDKPNPIDFDVLRVYQPDEYNPQDIEYESP